MGMDNWEEGKAEVSFMPTAQTIREVKNSLATERRRHIEELASAIVDEMERRASKTTAPKPKKAKAECKPTLDEVKAYCLQRRNNVDPEKWFNFYESKGWMIGKNKMKSWQAAVRTWEKTEASTNEGWGNFTR